MFYQKLPGQSVSQINAYWTRLLFTGRAAPPRPSTGIIVKAVVINPDAIAYINRKDLTPGMKIVFKL